MDSFLSIESKWGVSPDDPHRVTEPWKLIVHAKHILNINDTSCPEHIQSVFTEHIEDLVEAYDIMKSEGCDFETNVRVNRVLELAYYAQNACMSVSRMAELMDQNNDFRDNTDVSIFRFRSIDPSENTKYQNFLLYILGHFYKMGFARYNDNVYKSITYDGFNTRAWKLVGSISDTIYASVCKETNYDQFINLTHRGDSVRSATEFLNNCKDNQFPKLTKDRHVFSFRNGIYFADTDTFVKYGTDAHKAISSNLVSSKFFNHDFIDYSNVEPEEIPTPLLDSIFSFQRIDTEVMKWVYIMTGRIIYNIDELDGWQVIFFVQGQAGTGKSTYANSVCKQFYDEEDVGVMSNNIQKKFGLSDLVDKLLYVAPEIKRDFSIEQGEFQSIISGDKVTINIKCKSSRFENWTIPGVMAGNESPDFVDNAGSIQRRLVTLRFKQKVKKGDLLLGKKISHEMHAIIQKCNKFYRREALVNGRENIWTLLPQYFVDSQQELAKATNPLIHFMLSENIVIDSSKFVPEKVFTSAFNQHCKENNYNKPRFNPDFYLGPFAQYGVHVVYNEARLYQGITKRGTYFVGMDIKYDDAYDNFDDSEL